jgi:hypothetical protein
MSKEKAKPESIEETARRLNVADSENDAMTRKITIIIIGLIALVVLIAVLWTLPIIKSNNRAKGESLEKIIEKHEEDRKRMDEMLMKELPRIMLQEQMRQKLGK